MFVKHAALLKHLVSIIFIYWKHASLNYYYILVNPEDKRRIDDQIKEAQVALTAIEAQAGELTAEDAVITKHQREYTASLVRAMMNYNCTHQLTSLLECSESQAEGNSKSEGPGSVPGKQDQLVSRYT